MTATMNDVDEMRLEAAAACGDLTRQSERWQSVGDNAAGIAMYTNDILHTGTIVQHARDLEAWVTLRMRIEALRDGGEYWDEGNGAINDVLDIMDELEGP